MDSPSSCPIRSLPNCTVLPGAIDLLRNLSEHATPSTHLAIASSASEAAFAKKTSQLPSLTALIPTENRVFGDSPGMSDARKKPAPDIFLLALGKINKLVAAGGKDIVPEECVVFEDSIAGVEAGRRAGMRVVWVPHPGLREVCRGKEEAVLMGRSEGLDGMDKESGKENYGQGSEGIVSSDGWAEMLGSLDKFEFGTYGINVSEHT